MPMGREETTPGINTLKPYVELFRTKTQSQLHIPERFQDQSRKLFEDAYAQDSVTRMRESAYNPTIIGYDHPDDKSDLPLIKNRLLALKDSHPGKTLKVAHEMIPP